MAVKNMLILNDFLVPNFLVNLPTIKFWVMSPTIPNNVKRYEFAVLDKCKTFMVNGWNP